VDTQCYTLLMTIINDLQVDNLSLLYGKPVLIIGSGFSITPKKLKDIAILGEELYFKYLNVATMEMPSLELEELNNIDTTTKDYFLLMMLLNQSIEFRFTYEQALTFFLDVSVTYNTEEQSLYYKLDDDEILFIPEQIEAIKYVLRKQHNLETQKESENPADEIAKKIIEKQKAGREKVAKIKQTQESKITFCDLVSGAAVFSSSLNILNI